MGCQVGERVDAIGGGMMALGHRAHGRVGVYGINAPEWMMAMQARRSLQCFRAALRVGGGKGSVSWLVTRLVGQTCAHAVSDITKTKHVADHVGQ